MELDKKKDVPNDVPDSATPGAWPSSRVTGPSARQDRASHRAAPPALRCPPSWPHLKSHDHSARRPNRLYCFLRSRNDRVEGRVFRSAPVRFLSGRTGKNGSKEATVALMCAAVGVCFKVNEKQHVDSKWSLPNNHSLHSFNVLYILCVELCSC